MRRWPQTIAETLKKLPRDHYTTQQIAPYIAKHQGRRFFGANWAEDDLLTLIALQSQVSCKNESPADTRGNGTVDLIEFFQKVHADGEEIGADGAGPRMALLSGSTHILFDGTYQLRENSNGTKVIAFNEENDLEMKPDPKYVHRLKAKFPGTVISIRFPLVGSSTTST